MEQLFAGQEVALQEKVNELLGPEGFSQYQDYTRNLVSYLNAEQFKPQLTGEKEVKEQKSKKLYELMQQETQAALSETGLPADYQTLPILNFRNMASEEQAEKNLKLMESVYDRVATKASGFLSAEEMKQFDE